MIFIWLFTNSHELPKARLSSLRLTLIGRGSELKVDTDSHGIQRIFIKLVVLTKHMSGVERF